jgi:regulator of protease activity HflC (stomatin/prohibitin superfamily)
MDITAYSVIAIAIAFILLRGIRIVPQQQAWVVQRLGKFNRKIEAGLHLVIPIIDGVAQKHSLKEEAVDVHEQTAITKDNVSVRIDGILYLKIIDPVAATYGVSDARYALTQLAQTTMRSEIGKIALDKTFEEREQLNSNIVHTINEAAVAWGIQCMRYEIKDIDMPEDIRKAMELQMTAERQKRARILESEGMRQAAINKSEGERQAEINNAEAEKQRLVLESEGAQQDLINRAEGEAKALKLIAEGTSIAIRKVAASIQEQGGEKAASLRIAEQYVQAFSGLAKEGTNVILPANVGDVGSMTAQALSIYNALQSPKEQLNGVGVSNN